MFWTVQSFVSDSVSMYMHIRTILGLSCSISVIDGNVISLYVALLNDKMLSNPSARL